MEDQRDSIVPAGCRIRARRARSATTWGERDGASARGAKLDGRAVERAKLSRAGAAAWARVRRSVANDLCVILLRESRARRHFLRVITPSRDRVRPSFLSSELLDPPKNDRKKKTKEIRVTEYLACIPCFNLGLGVFMHFIQNCHQKSTRARICTAPSQHIFPFLWSLFDLISRDAHDDSAHRTRSELFGTTRLLLGSGARVWYRESGRALRLYFSRAIPRGAF